MLPKLLIWDWNGTVLDDWKLCYTIENEMLTERNMPQITEAWYLDHFSFPIEAYYRMMGYTFEKESFERLSEVFMERYNARYRTCALRSGVAEVLKTIQEKGIPQTLLSVTRQDDLIRQTEQFGTARYFTGILGQTDILGYSKIDRAKAFMAHNGIDPKTVVFIGDTDHDYQAATAAGCSCVLLTGGHQSEAVLARCGVPVFHTVDALMEALEI